MTDRSFRYPENQSALHCERVSLPYLARKYGTPLYVYSAGQIVDRYRLFSDAFAHRDHLICYSVKANSNLSILKLLADRGSGFDIVSGGELERILEVNKKAARRVVFSGVGKTAPEIDLALAAGILIFNVESESEVALLAERARKRKVRARVALRVNPDVFAETHPYISTGLREHKFGIDIKLARHVYQEAKRSRFLDPVGISVHIGSQIQTAEPFGAALEAVANLIRELKTDGIEIKFVDAGGGLGIDYLPSSSAFDPVASMEGYAAALERSLGGLEVRLLLEPGRFLVAQAGALLAKVLYVKRNGSKTFVITDAGMNDLIRPALYQAYHEIVPVIRDSASKPAIVDIVGPVCETGDFFARDRSLQEVKEGDLVAILDAGAYGMSLSSNYNTRPRPAEVLVKGKRARLVRCRETIQDLTRQERRLL
ncbi:MAG TPA: diaminopimelate decarboxylase [Chthoniobacterales bacterium]